MERIKIRRIKPEELNDRLLLINLYFTQGLTLALSLIIMLFQWQNPLRVLKVPEQPEFVWWGLGLAGLAFAVDFVLSKIISENAMDDGGINEMLFRRRPVWHIILISVMVAVCEEMLFRGAVQHSLGPYWTSILFAVIHVRYLRHWLPTAWVFASSYGLGYIYIASGTIWAPILCHFLIDLISGLVIRFRRET
ncbi:CPBP family intramembrane glutamic endopeptidase [Paenibacillus pinistramenti]|uniref:CPBP family intramembrane glutamic endopeptidase n=1 Tax=Paenibacillus pinistramenti TaxID=1768003 RepID=UPI003B8314B4